MVETLWEDYAARYPEERGKTDLCRDFLNGSPGLPEEYGRGHLTGSAWIINRERTRIVLLHHGKLDAWLQPGGHLEDGETPLEGAMREAREETGLSSLRPLDEGLFDLDIHLIPPHGDQPGHYHYDLRFLLEADDSESLVLSHESRDLLWIPLEDIPLFSRWESVWRMALKSSPWAASPVFGELEEGIEYGERIGVYALARDGQGRVALIGTPRGYFLPGGGLERGESREECLIREMAEETGMSVRIGPYLGRSSLFGFTPRQNGYMKLVGLYYTALISERAPGERREGDHQTLWFSPQEARERLHLPHQAWAVEKFLLSRKPGI